MFRDRRVIVCEECAALLAVKGGNATTKQAEQKGWLCGYLRVGGYAVHLCPGCHDPEKLPEWWPHED